MDIVEKDGGSQALRQNWRERVPVVRPVLAETQAARHGIQRTDVASALQAAFQGKTVGVFREGNTRSEDRIIPIVSRPSEEERLDVDNINDVQIYSPAADRMIPIRQVITHFETVYENQIVWRFNRRPTITIHCDPRTGEASELHGRIKEPFERLIPEKQAAGTLPDGYMMEWGGEYESSQKAQAGLVDQQPPCPNRSTAGKVQRQDRIGHGVRPFVPVSTAGAAAMPCRPAGRCRHMFG